VDASPQIESCTSARKRGKELSFTEKSAGSRGSPDWNTEEMSTTVASKAENMGT